MSTYTNLFNALGYFLENVRPYVVKIISAAEPKEPWEGVLFTKLGPDQQRIWNLAQNSLSASGGSTENLIDYNILFTFGVSFKDELKQDLGNYNDVNKLINFFKELKETRNKCQHFQELEEDEITRAYLNMKGAAKLLKNTALYNEIQRIQNGDNIESTPEPVPVQVASAPVSSYGAEESLPSWFNAAIPHYDIRNVKLDESIFAANLSEVALGTGPDVYTEPQLFFGKTYVTEGLKDISNRVVRALNGEESENRVISLQTGFGGGKTHTLISLYHIVKNGRRIEALAKDMKLFSNGVSPNFDSAKVAVFTNNTTDVSQGRITDEGFYIYTIWGEIAYQLGGVDAYNAIKQNDVERTTPSASLIKPILESCSPSLILIDELADYCVKATAKKVGQGTLFNQTNSFIQTLTEVVASVPKCVLIVTLPASATEVAATAIGQEVLNSLETRVVRVGTSVKPVDDEEIFEVVRRRLFEQMASAEVIDKVAKRYQNMYHNRINALPGQCDNLAYINRIRKSYPFHPELIDMFRLRWGNDPRFQRTRGVLRLLASIVQDLWKRRDSLNGVQALIHTSDVNLENLSTLTGTINNLMGSNWETVMHADVYGTSSNAYKIDNKDVGGPLFNFKLTQGVATTLLLASVGGDHQHGLSIPELKLCVLKPNAFNHNDVNGALSQLEEVAHYLYSSNTGGKRFWFQSKANINILLNQAKAEVSTDEMNVEILKRLRGVNMVTGFSKILVDPSEDIPEQKALTLVIMHPKYAIPIDKVDNASARFITNTATKRGQSDRVYRNTMIYLACSEAGRASLNTKLADFLACNKILSDYSGALERDQKTEIESRKRTYDNELSEALIQAYSVVLKHSAKGGISRYNLHNFSRDFSSQLSMNMLSELRDEEWILDSVGRKTLDDNSLLPTVGAPVPVKLLYEAFLKYDDKPMISGPDAIIKTVGRYCSGGLFNVTMGRPDNWSRIFVETEHIPFLDVNSEDYWLVDSSVVEMPATPEQPEEPGSTTPATPTTPTPKPEGGDDTPSPAVREFRSITINGQVEVTNWTQLMSSFIMPLKNNNLQLEVRIKAKSTAMNPLTENSATYRAVKESAAQLGLEMDEEVK